MIRNERLGWKILNHFEKEIDNLPASTKNHSNFKYGLINHLEKVLTIAKLFFKNDEHLYFMALVHDLGKARCYYWGKDGKPKHLKPDIDHHFLTIIMLMEFGLKLTREEINAIQFHHGVYSPFLKGEKTSLALKLNFCDEMACLKEVTINHDRI